MKTATATLVRLFAVGLSVGVSLVAKQGEAQSNYFTGSSWPWQWTSPGNWSAGVPTAGQEVFVTNGANPWLDAGASGFASNLYINNGTVLIGGAISAGTLTVGSGVFVGTTGEPATLALTNNNFGYLFLNRLVIGSTGLYTDRPNATITFIGESPTVDVTPDTIIRGTVAGTSGLTKDGVGTLILAGTNSYSGVTMIINGALQVGNGGTVGNLGNGDVTNNSLLIFNRSDDLTVDNLVTGTGSLTQNGSGKLILAADNDYTGGTWINSGVLQVGNGGTSGWLGTGDVVNDSSLVFNRSDTIGMAYPISGTGSLTHMGGGLLILYGTNSYSGGTFVTNAGSLFIGNGGALGSGTVHLFSGTTMGFLTDMTVGNNVILYGDPTFYVSNGNTVVETGSISGAGDLVKAGGGTLILAADNGYTGPTTINEGVLQIGTGGTTGTLGAGDVTNFCSLIFNRSDDLTVNNLVTGAGSLTQNGSGKLILAADNDYSGGTWINSGVLQVGNGGTSGWLGTGDVVNDSSLVFNRSDTIGMAYPISGTGSLTHMGGGLLILYGTNSYSGGTFVTNSSSLFVGNGAAVGSGTVHLFDGTTLGFLSGMTFSNNVILYGDPTFYVSNGDTVVETGSISGAGDLVKAGGGTLILAADNSYTGPTIISNGVLQIGNGGTIGTLGSGDVNNFASLIFNRSDAFTVSNLIAGTGSLTMTGDGVLTLSASNTYSGGTVINSSGMGSSGILAGNDSAFGTGSITINAASYIGSSGGARTLNNAILFTSYGGLDNSGGTLTLNGSISGGGIAPDDGLYLWGGGTTVFTGNNDYTNTFIGVDGPAGVTLPNTVLQIGNGGTSGTLGAGLVEIGNNCTLTFNRSDTITVGNYITGDGALNQIGGGTLILTGLNDYTGGTFVTNSSSLFVGNASAVGSGTVHLFDGTTLGFLTGMTFNNNVILYGDPTFYVSNGDTVVETGSISGAGDLVKAGGGTLILAADNSYTGPTIINSGVLQIGNCGTTGTLGSGDVTNFSSLIFSRSDAITVSNLIAGTGSLTKNCTGTLTLAGANTYSGGTWINNGMLVVANDSALGSGDVNMNGGALGTEGDHTLANNFHLLQNGTFDTSGGNLTINGNIDGSGALIQTGGGMLILNGTNTYGGGTVLGSNSVVQIAYSTSLGSGTITMYNGSMLVFTKSMTLPNDVVLLADPTFYVTNGATVVETGVVSGDGDLFKAGGGTLTLAADNTYSGATIISNGVLKIGDGAGGGFSGSLGTGVVTNFASLIFNRADDIIVSNNISGTGSLTQLGSGTTILVGSNDYSGVTRISGGTLQVGDGGTAGNLGTGIVTNNSVLSFNRSDTYTVNNVINGSGVLVQNGTGSLILAASNNYYGGTWVNSGTIVVASGKALGNVAADVYMNGGALAVQGDQTVYNPVHLLANGTFDTAGARFNLSGTIDGDGALIATGGGTLTLRGNGNSYFGGTIITNATTVLVGRDYALGYGPVTMSDGTTLGFIGNYTIDNALQLNGNSLLYVTNNMNGTESGDISGGGTLLKIGAGTLTLAGNNTYSGATIISNGVLRIGDGGASGTLGTGPVTNFSSLIFYRADDFTVANSISGTGSLTQNGDGTVTLTGNNDYSGITRILNGALQVGDGGTSGSLGTGNVIDNGSLIFNRSDAITVNNAISGSGSLTQQGSGTLTLAANNTHSGGTWINNGHLLVATDTALGTGDVTMNGGTLAAQGNRTLANDFHLDANGLFNTANGNLILNGQIDGDGAVYNLGGGILTLNGANSYTGGTILLSNAVIHVGNDTGLGLGQVTMYNGSMLVFTKNLNVANDIQLLADPTLYVTNGATVVESGVISGTGDLFKAGGGTLTLAGNNTYSGATIISNGVLQIGNGGTSGTLGTGPVTNFSSLLFNRSDTMTVSNTISGTGSLTQLGSGTTILVGNNDYSGITRILNGTLQVGDGGTSGSLGTGNVIDNGSLIFNRSDAIIVSNTISGTGSLTQQGSGTLTLAGNNSYSGGTWINNGHLMVATDTALGTGDVTMNGGTLGAQGNRTLANNFHLLADGLFNTANGNLTLNGQIDGSGAVYNFGGGILTLNGANSYTGGTILNSNAIIHVGNDTALGLGQVTMYYGSMLVFTKSLNIANDILLLADPTLYVTNGATVVESGVISGNGDLFKAGQGILVLAGNNTYSGVTIISNGVLQVGNGGFTGTLGTGPVTNFSSLVFNRADDITVANSISGTGSLTQNGLGVVTLTGNNDYSGITLLNIGAGALQIGNGGTSGTLGTGDVIDNSSLIFNRSDTMHVSNNISGIGSVIQEGGGITVMTGNNTYQGGTWINNGTLAAGSSTAFGIGAVTMNGGTLGAQGNQTLGNAFHMPSNGVFDTVGGNLTLNGQIDGIGWLVKVSTGSLTLNGANSYSGGTSNQAGWLVVGHNTALGTGWLIMDGGTLSSGGGTLQITLANPVYLANDGTVDTGGGNLTLTGPVTGPNDLWKLGPNTLSLWGNTNVYQNTYVIAGTLAVVNSSVTTNINVHIGYFTNNAAGAVKDHGTLWRAANAVFVGNNGNFNSLTVTNGGWLSDYDAVLGYFGNGNTALVSGSNSLWHSDNELLVGYYGASNSLTVNKEGALSSVFGYVGFGAGYNTVVITDTNSVWNNSADLIVGYLSGGDFNSLVITNGAKALAGDSWVGAGNANNNSASVSGPGSLWNNTGDLTIGDGAVNNLLLINNSALVSNQDGFVGFVGSTNTAVVSGAGSAWINRGNLVVGINASQNSVTVADGAYLQDQNGYVGAINADNNRALVTGAGSRWVNYGDLFVGYDPSSNNSLLISNGAVVIATNTWLGYDAGSTNNSITVTDPGSLLLDYGDLTVGVTGSYNWVSVLNGGTVSNNNAYIGLRAASAGNWAVVDNSSWVTASNLYIGAAGDLNSLTIRNGGTVSDLNAYIGFDYGANSNSAVVNAGTWNNANSFIVGYRGDFNTLTVSNGGIVRDTWGYIGVYGNTNTATVNGGAWYNSQDFTMGYVGRDNALIITNGGVLTDVHGTVGQSGSNNMAVVTGAGSSWTNSGNLYVGMYSAFNSLSIRNGGYVQDVHGFVGYTNANNNTALVTDAGSRWLNTGNLTVGRYSQNNVLIVSNGAVVQATRSFIGAVGNTNRAWVVGAGSVWANSDHLYVGTNGSYNLLVILNGAVVSNLTGYIGHDGGVGNTAVVNNATWINNGGLSMGWHSGNNVLLVTNAGVVKSASGLIGSGANANRAYVTGAGSVWGNAGNVWIGDQGLYNLLVVENGGLVSNVNAYVGVWGNINSAIVNNATWINTGSLSIGTGNLVSSNPASRNVLIVTNGGVVRDVVGIVGDYGNANEAWVTGPGSLWNNSGNLYVGRNGHSNLLMVLNGAVVQDIYGYLGEYGNLNTAVVNNATWISANNLLIGHDGFANVLSITNGGVVRDASGYLGWVGHANQAWVNGTGSLWANSGDLYIGQTGRSNLLTILNGGLVSNANGWVGQFSHLNTAVVNNATWINTGNLVIGYLGVQNVLSITNGGVVRSSSGVVGASGNNNSATIAGAGSLWDNALDLYIGSNSSYNILRVLNGGLVSNRHGYIGYSDAPASYNTGIVNNATWVNTGNLTVGHNDDYNLLTVTNNGKVFSVNGYVGVYAGGQNNRADVVGTGSLWRNTGDLFVGLNGGSFNGLQVLNGGTVSNVNGYVGNNANYNWVSVADPGSLWNNSGNLYVGSNGWYNSLYISNSALVSNVHGYVGYADAGTSYNNATWVNTGNLTIGLNDDHNTLNVYNNGKVFSVNGYVGVNQGADYNQATVDGAGSLWRNTGDLFVGLNGGSFNGLRVLNGGTVSNVNGYVGNNANYNWAQVQYAGSLWNNSGDLNIGTNGIGNSLFIYLGGVVNDVNGYVGNGGNADYNWVVVNGAGAVWNNASSLFIGRSGDYNSLEVSSGARVNSTYGYVGWAGTGNWAVVTGTGSLWNNASNLEVGEYGYNNTLTIQSGGVVSNAMARIGYYGVANSVLVTDAGSLWNNSGELRIGEHGYYNSLTVTNGGVVRSTTGYVGYNSGNNNSALVTGTGSLWANSLDLYIGASGAYNLLSILNGGLVSNRHGFVGYGAVSYNTAMVNNATWVNTGSLTVGYNDHHNALIVMNNGKVYSASGYVGAQSGGDYNSALVTGTGSLWNNTGDLFVGLNGGSYNTLSIEANGTVASRNLYVGDASSAGNLVNVTGGNLVVTNPAGGLVQLDNGSLYFDTGNILLNYLRVNPNGNYTDTGAGLLTLVNPNPTIEIAGGKIVTVHSTIAGSQGMIKAGAGELILTAANIYTGPTFVNNGTLTVQNSRGVGYGNMNVINGTLRTGSENTGNPLELQISGSYTQAVNGQVELGVGGTTFPQNDWLNIGGGAALDGTLRVFKLGTFVPTPFDEAVLVVATGGVNGTFSQFIDEIPASPMLDSTLLYHPNDVTLTWQQLPFTPWAITPNQLAVAGALDSALTNPVMKALFTRLDYPNWPNIPTTNELAQTLPRDFDLIAPDELTALFSLPFAAMDMRGYSFLARINELRAGSHGFSAARLTLYNNGPTKAPQAVCQTQSPITTPCADICAPTKDNPWGLYVEGNGEYADIDSDANATGYHLRSAGVTVGLDRRIGQHWAVGLTLGYAYDHAGLINDGSVNVDAARGSLYATWFNKGWHLEAMAIGGLNWYKTKRTAIDGVARGDTDGYEYGGLIGGGYDWQKGIWFFGPQVTLQYKGVHIDSFKEEGSLSPLEILSQSQESLYTRVGAHVGCRAKVGKQGKIIVAPDLSLAWQHEYLDDALAIDSRFANGAGNIFTVHGPEVGRDSLVIGAGIWVQWSPTVGTYLNYTTQLLRDGYEPHNLNAGILIKF